MCAYGRGGVPLAKMIASKIRSGRKGCRRHTRHHFLRDHAVRAWWSTADRIYSDGQDHSARTRHVYGRTAAARRSDGHRKAEDHPVAIPTDRGPGTAHTADVAKISRQGWKWNVKVMEFDGVNKARCDIDSENTEQGLSCLFDGACIGSGCQICKKAVNVWFQPKTCQLKIFCRRNEHR